MTSIAVCAVSYRSPETIRRSLESWAGLRSELIAERKVWFQEITENDRKLATRHGFEAMGTAENAGLMSAYSKLVDSCSSEYFMFLEDDWQLTQPHAREHLQSAIAVIESGEADLVRLRSTRRPGWPLNTIILRGKDSQAEHALIETCYWERRPDLKFPGRIRRTQRGGETWFTTTAANAAWTNNAHIARVELLKEILVVSQAHGVVLEPAVNAWWPGSGTIVAQGRGLFTHIRVDGPSARSTLVRELTLEAKRRIPGAIYQRLRR